MKLSLSLFFLLLIVYTANGQLLTSGLVIDKTTGEAIASAAVRNTSRQMITVTTRLGAFQIFAFTGDSLAISCVGYLSQKLIVPKNDDKLIVELLPEIKTLNEVVVKAWSESRFKEEFLKAQVPEKVKIDIEAPPGIWGIPMGNFGRMGHDHVTMTPKMTLKGPISIIYDKFSRETKIKKRLAKFQQAEARRQQYQQKMDTLWLSRVTDLKGERLGRFVKFCNLSETFVLSVDEYELVVAVRGCLKEFLGMGE